MVRQTYFVLLAALLSTVALVAGPIGPNCGTCQGSIYSLSFLELVDANPNTQKFQIEYAIDTSGYTGGGVAIDSVALKVATGNDIVSVSLTSAPTPLSDWKLIPGGINAGGCQENSSNGFECADFINLASVGVPVPTNNLLVWTFIFEVDNGTLKTGDGEASIKARYVKANGTKQGALVSENITLMPPTVVNEVPEPATLLLLSAGLMGLGSIRRRRRRRGSETETR